MTRSISLRRPITGSSSPFLASSVRSRPNARSAGVLTSFFEVGSPSSASEGVKLGSSSFRTGAHLFLDLHAHGLEIESHFLENVDRDTLAELDQSEQKMLGTDIVVIEAVSLFASKLQDLLGARSKIVHCSDDAVLEPLPESAASLLISGLGSTFKRARIIWARRWSRSSAFSFCCDVFCRCAGWVSMNNSSIGSRFSSGNAPRSIPSLMMDSKLSASFELMACA